MRRNVAPEVRGKKLLRGGAELVTLEAALEARVSIVGVTKRVALVEWTGARVYVMAEAPEARADRRPAGRATSGEPRLARFRVRGTQEHTVVNRASAIHDLASVRDLLAGGWNVRGSRVAGRGVRRRRRRIFRNGSVGIVSARWRAPARAGTAAPRSTARLRSAAVAVAAAAAVTATPPAAVRTSAAARGFWCVRSRIVTGTSDNAERYDREGSQASAQHGLHLSSGGDEALRRFAAAAAPTLNNLALPLSEMRPPCSSVESAYDCGA